MATSKSSKQYDVVLYGASGFVGRQTVDYFAKHPEVKSAGLTWALAGRSADKLEAVLKASGASAAHARSTPSRGVATPNQAAR